MYCISSWKKASKYWEKFQVTAQQYQYETTGYSDSHYIFFREFWRHMMHTYFLLASFHVTHLSSPKKKYTKRVSGISIYNYPYKRERERERERDRQTDRQTDRRRVRQTDRQTGRQRDREREGDLVLTRGGSSCDCSFPFWDLETSWLQCIGFRVF